MKKIVFVILVLALLFTAGCTNEVAPDDNDISSEDTGYVDDLDSNLDTSDLDNLDDDLNLDWI
jgi:PBP1b-binding outer membrane lipoprotein LpoB